VTCSGGTPARPGHAEARGIDATLTGPRIAELLHNATIAQASLTDPWHAVPSLPTVSKVWLRLLEPHGHK